MKKKDLIDALGHVDDKHLEEAEQIREKKKVKFPSLKVLAPVAVAAGVFLYFAGSFLGNEGGNITNNIQPNVLAQADYPSLTKVPNEEDYTNDNGEVDYDKIDEEFNKWDRDQKQLETDQEPYIFYQNYREFLKNANAEMFENLGDKNLVYSPLNIYMASSMLAELSDGNTQKQIFDLLHSSTIEEIRANAKDIWKNNYQDDGKSTSILANSMWTKEGLEYNKATLAELTKNYYASLYEGNFGDEEYNKLLKEWINKNTNNLLEDSADGLKFKDNTVMALISTIYYQDSWKDNFDPNQNTKDVFKSPSGDQNVEFMNSKVETMGYEGNNFMAADLDYGTNAAMMFIKPKEGNTLQDVMKSEDFNKLLENSSQYENSNKYDVNFKVPKFDITSDLDMIEIMKKLGITDVFDPAKSDLSRLMENDNNMFVDQFQHSARVKIDEEGTEAAAYTVIAIEETAYLEEPEEIDMKLDEPFIFAIRNKDGAVTFVGAVNSID